MSFRDLIGHQPQIEALGRLLKSGRVPHGMLFSGPDGVGKQLVAEALVAAKFCERKGADACGECKSCRSLSRGNHPDFERIEREPGKRDIGIGQIRELLDILHRKGHTEWGRAAVIRDAERMTTAAQNSFLKTLEEPPPDALLVLVTSRLERILPTVRSRCSLWRFGPLSDAELLEFARTRTDATLDLPLSLAQGSPGRLLGLADDRLMRAREALIRFVAGSSDLSAFDLAALLQECASVPAQEEGDVPDDGRELGRDRLLGLTRMLSLALRDLALLSLGLEEKLLFNRDRNEALAARARSLDPESALEALEVVDQLGFHLRRNMDAGLALEEGLLGVSKLIGRR
ncbi:MAG: DNA polymerase III subunit delta' [Planctomycetota bacterium]